MTKPRLKPARAKRAQLTFDWLSTDLIEILPAAVYVCDADAVVVAYNRRATELGSGKDALRKIDPQSLATGQRTSKVVGSDVVNEFNESLGRSDDTNA